MPWAPAKTAAATALIESMKTLHFAAMGANRSYWDFYQGFGLSVAIYLLAQAFVLWFLAGLTETNAAGLRGIVIVFLVATLANACVTFQYFFVAPMLFTLAIALSLSFALFTLRRA